MAAVPFVVGQWVRGNRFYGRAAQIAEILDGPRNWIWLLGTRRLGKTSLLKQLEQITAEAPERGYFPIFWDLQGAEDEDGLNESLTESLFDAEERFEQIAVDLSTLEGPDPMSTLSKTRRRLRSAGYRLLLLCDEAEELLTINRTDTAFLRKLRRALQSHDDMRSVLASTIRLWQLTDQRGDTSPFLHGFTPPLYISTLTDDEARALIRQTNLADTDRPTFASEEVEQIRSRCDNHPYLIQLVCKRFVETGHLDDVCAEVAVDRMVGYFFSIDFEMLAPIEQSILRLMAQRSAVTGGSIQDDLRVDPSSVGAALQRLEQLAFIRRGEDRRFMLRNSFFRRWLEDWFREYESDAVETLVGAPVEASTPVPSIQRLGTVDGRYELLEHVGEGATGIVYKARDRMLHTDIAIKMLRPEYSQNDSALERFRQEIILSRDIGHPNVLRTYHLGEHQNRKYLTMQWVDGQTLEQLIKADAPLDEAVSIEIAMKITAALAAAHVRKVLHRDIKPQNILVDRSHEPYLVDFGAARVLGGPGLSSNGIFFGTPNYASPEQARLQTLDERSDLYSLGVVLFEMTTGRRPFSGRTSQDVLERHKSEPAPDPRRLRPSLSTAISAVILRCLEKDAASRFTNASTLGEALSAMR